MRAFLSGLAWIAGVLLFAVGAAKLLIAAVIGELRVTPAPVAAAVAFVAGAVVIRVANYMTRGAQAAGPAWTSIALALGSVVVALLNLWAIRLGRPDLEAWTKPAQLIATFALSGWTLYDYRRRGRPPG